jgi:hypothetical protein
LRVTIALVISKREKEERDQRKKRASFQSAFHFPPKKNKKHEVMKTTLNKIKAPAWISRTS